MLRKNDEQKGFYRKLFDAQQLQTFLVTLVNIILAK